MVLDLSSYINLADVFCGVLQSYSSVMSFSLPIAQSSSNLTLHNLHILRSYDRAS